MKNEKTKRKSCTKREKRYRKKKKYNSYGQRENRITESRMGRQKDKKQEKSGIRESVQKQSKLKRRHGINGEKIRGQIYGMNIKGRGMNISK